jgi:DNA polymerase III delta prime subunit
MNLTENISNTSLIYPEQNVNDLISQKYKPHSIEEFGELIDNEDFDFDFDFENKNQNLKLSPFVEIYLTLKKMNDINILFIGGSCSGKTTLLYCILRDYYCQTPNETNVMFINNLKEQGINFYRNEMKTFCQSHCSIYGKKKFVVIDDIDSINEQSQQVFRNYIDKYKNNVNFISVCTNVQKVIESIQSRLQIIKIPQITNDYLYKKMNYILKCENINIENEAKDYLINISNNSIRILLNNIEKIYICGGGADREKKIINLSTCKYICSNVSFDLFEKYIYLLRDKNCNGNIIKATKLLYQIYDYGYSVIDVLDYFFIFVKNTEILNEKEKYCIIPCLCKYITIFYNTHENVIELALFTKSIFEEWKENI